MLFKTDRFEIEIHRWTLFVRAWGIGEAYIGGGFRTFTPWRDCARHYA